MPQWVFYAMLAVVSWGVWGIASKLASDSALLNQILSTIGLIPTAAVVLRQLNWSRPGAIWSMLGGVTGGLGNLFFLAALTRGGKASVVVPLTAVYPLITVALAWLVLHEKLHRRQLLGLVLALAAIVFLNREESVGAGALQGSFGWMTLTIVALCFYGASALFQKLGTNLVPAESAFVGFTGGFIAVAIVILLTDSFHIFAAEPIRWSVGARPWFWGILGGVLNGLGVLASLAAYRLGGKASIVTPLTGLYPVVTVFLAVSLLGEKIDTFKTAGIALALAAAVILSYEPETTDDVVS